MTGIFVAWSERPNSPGWVEDGTGCHIWVGANRRGYGHVWANGMTKSIHRLRYEREVGPIPGGMELDHYICDNGPGGCCNPRHCRPVTTRENQLRSNSVSALNAAKTHCPRGHPLEGDNLAKEHLNRGRRACRACKIALQRVRRKASRA